jgi:transposase-like protein
MPRRVRECGNLHRFTTEEVLVHTHDAKRQEQEDKQREVAMVKGTIQDVANYYGVDPKSVRAWRKKYRQI